MTRRTDFTGDQREAALKEVEWATLKSMAQSKWSPARFHRRPSQSQRSNKSNKSEKQEGKVHADQRKRKECLKRSMSNGSSGGRTKDCLAFDKEKHDVFVRIEHRL